MNINLLLEKEWGITANLRQLPNGLKSAKKDFEVVECVFTESLVLLTTNPVTQEISKFMRDEQHASPMSHHSPEGGH